jgi:hypothetical protein
MAAVPGNFEFSGAGGDLEPAHLHANQLRGRGVYR